MPDPLARRRSLPPGGHIEHWPATDGHRLRVGLWPDGRGPLLFLGGRGDFFEKYAEALWHLRDRGWAVVAPDWRGQGGSGQWRWSRGGDGFARLVTDLRHLAARAAGAGPLVAVGHSMGGHLLLRALLEGETAIARAVALAPMVGLPVPAHAPRLARALVALGLGDRPIPGQSGGDGRARAARLTSDPVRQPDERWWRTRHPELARGPPTLGWLAAAFESNARLIARPPLAGPARARVVLADGDVVVSNAAARAHLPRLLGPGALIELPGAHELLRETTATQAALWAALDPYLEAA